MIGQQSIRGSTSHNLESRLKSLGISDNRNMVVGLAALAMEP